MHFILNHMLEFLVIDRPKEDVRREGFAGDAACDEVFPRVTEAVLDKYGTHIIDFASSKCCAIF